MTKNKTKMGATAFRLCTNNWPKIAVIPNDIPADVAHICEEFVAAEQVILDYLKTTGPTPSGLAEARVESTRQIKLLGDRVRKK